MASYTRLDPPPPNVWCGISASNGDEWEAAIDQLYRVQASVRWISLEPLVSPFMSRLAVRHLSRDCYQFATHTPKWEFISWVVVGCESGPRRRPYPESTARHIIDGCHDYKIPVFHKQMPINGSVSHDPSEWPEWARVREWPEVES
jgi:protein gp37